MKSPIKFKFLLIGAIIVALLSGCASTPRITNLSPAYLYSTPSVSSYKNPEADISDYQTFSVFPQSLISENTKMNEILEKQVLFFLRNELESKGYKFVELNQRPDFLATVRVSSKYETTYVPPQTVTSPRWVPERTITSYSTSSGTLWGWGNYFGSSTSTIYVPGYMTTETYTRPGYTVGHFYPFAGISIYDGETLERVWLGTGAGASDSADVRVSSQFVIIHILAELPTASTPYDFYPSRGTLSVNLGIFTIDGNNYIPTITRVVKRSPAQTAGLRQYDMILAVDGVSVVNKSFRDVLDLIEGSPGTTTRLDVWRTGQELSIDVTRTSWETIQW